MTKASHRLALWHTLVPVSVQCTTGTNRRTKSREGKRTHPSIAEMPITSKLTILSRLAASTLMFACASPPCTLQFTLMPIFIIMSNIVHRQAEGRESCFFARRRRGTTPKICGLDRTLSINKGLLGVNWCYETCAPNTSQPSLRRSLSSASMT